MQDHKEYSSWEFAHAGPHEEGSEWDQTDSEKEGATKKTHIESKTSDSKSSDSKTSDSKSSDSNQSQTDPQRSKQSDT